MIYVNTSVFQHVRITHPKSLFMSFLVLLQCNIYGLGDSFGHIQLGHILFNITLTIEMHRPIIAAFIRRLHCLFPSLQEMFMCRFGSFSRRTCHIAQNKEGCVVQHQEWLQEIPKPSRERCQEDPHRLTNPCARDSYCTCVNSCQGNACRSTHRFA